MRTCILAALAAVALTGVAGAQMTEPKGNPGSLYNQGYVNPFADRIARKAGDVLTIIISESSVASYSATTKANKSDSNSINSQFYNEVMDRLFRPLSTGSTSSVSGDGTTTQNGKMSTRMSAVIKQVLPNGNLLIEGARSLVTNKETQTFKLSGTIRPDAVASDNTVKSELIADAEIRMEGKGMIQERQRKGILTRVLDWLF